MKKLFLLLIVFLGTATANTCAKTLWYAQLGGAGVTISGSADVSVAVGFGLRHIGTRSGVDISVLCAPGYDTAYSYVFPRLRYLYFVHPRFYVGAGVSYAEMRDQRRRRFSGVATELAAGIDLPTDGWARAFIELALSQPTIPTANHRTILGPTISLTFGVGL